MQWGTWGWWHLGAPTQGYHSHLEAAPLQCPIPFSTSVLRGQRCVLRVSQDGFQPPEGLLNPKVASRSTQLPWFSEDPPGLKQKERNPQNKVAIGVQLKVEGGQSCLVPWDIPPLPQPPHCQCGHNYLCSDADLLEGTSRGVSLYNACNDIILSVLSPK